eukprot:scaffold9857_cov127-Cylindrotheca_fusiformis.AAC.17
MTPLEIGGMSSAAVESAVDAYATRVLESTSPPEAAVDGSVGPYVTSLLRCADIQDVEEVTRLSEFDSLLELLEDQCSMEEEPATKALKAIAKAVCTGIVPHETTRSRSASVDLYGSTTTETRNRSASFGLYTGGGLDSFKSMNDSLPQQQTCRTSQDTPGGRIAPEPISTDPFTPLQMGGPSPIKMEALVPVDLLGALDNPSPHISRIGGHTHFRQVLDQQYQQQQEDPNHDKELSNDEEAFPTLAAALSAPSNKKSDKSGRGKKGTSKKHSDRELAAALFRPARPRQNSLDDTIISNSKPTSVPITSNENSLYFQQQLDSCLEILLSMNHDLSEEAARESARMANGDFNIAQYIVDAALSARPVCRHMLHDGCYRSDCQFSHDVEGHTCLFWLRGRCGKGSTCKFFHGFNPKLMEGVSAGNGSATLGQASMMSPGNPGSFPAPFGSFTNNSSTIMPNGYGSPPLSSSGFHMNGFDSKHVTPSPNSFANIASQGYDHAKFGSQTTSERSTSTSSATNLPTVRIPQDLWNPHENRDATVFHIPDPIERYNKVSANVKRRDVLDLHFQSTKTFATVLSAILPLKLSELDEVWIVTGTGHHVGSKTHQKGGGALERAVTAWLTEEGYNCYRGRDRNGLGGALLVKR